MSIVLVGRRNINRYTNYSNNLKVNPDCTICAYRVPRIRAVNIEATFPDVHFFLEKEKQDKEGKDETILKPGNLTEGKPSGTLGVILGKKYKDIGKSRTKQSSTMTVHKRPSRTKESEEPQLRNQIRKSVQFLYKSYDRKYLCIRV